MLVMLNGEIIFEDYPDEKLRIVNYKAKWIEDSFEYDHTPRTFEFPPDCGIVNMQFRRSVRDPDPVVVIQLSDTRYGQINFQWVIINDPDAERFQIHRRSG